MADDTTEGFSSQGAMTQVLLESGMDYRLLSDDLDAEGYTFSARAGHDVFELDGISTSFEIIIHEPLSGELSTFIGENTDGMARVRPYYESV